MPAMIGMIKVVYLEGKSERAATILFYSRLIAVQVVYLPQAIGLVESWPKVLDKRIKE